VPHALSPPGFSSDAGLAGLKSAVAPTVGGRRKELLFGLGLATLSGVFWFTGCGLFNPWPCAWAAMVPVLFAIERAWLCCSNYSEA
jgi:hypothetical protein